MKKSTRRSQISTHHGFFGIFTLGVAFYSAATMNHLDDRYRGLIQHESLAAVSLARANRNFQTMRANVGDIIMATDPAVLKNAKAEFDEAHGLYIEMMTEPSPRRRMNPPCPRSRRARSNCWTRPVATSSPPA